MSSMTEIEQKPICQGFHEDGVTKCTKLTKGGRPYCAKHMIPDPIKGEEYCRGILLDGFSRCGYKAKSGSLYCGRHEIKEEKILCKGICVRDGVTPCTYYAKDGTPYCGRHKAPKEKILCSAKYADGRSCFFEAKEGKPYCGLHETKYEKIDADNIVKAERAKIQEDYDKLHPKLAPVISEYRQSQLDIIHNIDKTDENNADLFVVKFPEAIKLIDFDKNKQEGIVLDFTKLTYGSNAISHWFCPNFIPDHGTYTSFTSKTSRYKVIDGKNIIQGCKVCCIDKIRVHDKDDVKNVIKEDRSTKKSTTKIGDASEFFIRDLLISTGRYKIVEKIGQNGCTGDLKVTHFDDSFNYVQVKTLTKKTDAINAFSSRNTNEYPPDMLLVFVDNSRKYLAMDFDKNLGNDAYFNFNDKASYGETKFDDQKLFLDKFHELVKLSTTVNSYSESYRKEKEMLERFNQYCKARGILYQKNDTNSDTIDGFINGFSFQAKFKGKNREKRLTWKINFSKNAGRLNGKNLRKAYEKGDFQFYVIELGETFDGKKNYIGNFLIIPHDQFVELDKFGVEGDEGATTISICPPDYSKPHWSKMYWNNITQLLNGKIKLNILPKIA